MTPLILASTSPYRRELLARLGLPFETHTPRVDETPRPDETPSALAVRLAREKALEVALRHPGATVIGSDQVADLDGICLGKPGNHEAATRQLRAMSGRVVHFRTAVAVVCPERAIDSAALVSVTVRFRTMSDAHIDRYLRTEQPYDCAGSAKSEGLGIVLLEAIDSDDPTALIGLPLIRTAALLREAGIDPLGGPQGSRTGTGTGTSTGSGAAV